MTMRRSTPALRLGDLAATAGTLTVEPIAFPMFLHHFAVFELTVAPVIYRCHYPRQLLHST